eukprot:m51a1_g6575 hypothetical protein (453) ;mRNA; f:194563-196604
MDQRDRKIGEFRAAVRSLLRHNRQLEAAVRTLLARVAALEAQLAVAESHRRETEKSRAVEVLWELEGCCARIQRAYRAARQRRRLAAARVVLRALRRNRWLQLWRRFMDAVHRKRNHVVREIVSSEASYVEQLAECVGVFLKPLLIVVPSVHHARVFANLEAIYALHSEVSAALQTRFSVWSSRLCITDILVTALPRMAIYEDYINNYDTSRCAVEELMKCCPEFRRHVEAQFSVKYGIGVFFLNSLLITPVQRLPRYKLLLEEACRIITRLAAQLNERKRVYEESLALRLAQPALSPSDPATPVVSPKRRPDSPSSPAAAVSPRVSKETRDMRRRSVSFRLESTSDTSDREGADEGGSGRRGAHKRQASGVGFKSFFRKVREQILVRPGTAPQTARPGTSSLLWSPPASPQPGRPEEPPMQPPEELDIPPPPCTPPPPPLEHEEQPPPFQP